MTDWILVPCLVSLRDEFNELAPLRDKASDGAIGDLAHQQEASDHNPDETGRTPYSDADHINEVHAIDVDDDLRKPGWTMAKCLEIIITRHRTGRDDRLQYIIYDRRICSRSWGWTWRPYTGPSAHTEHAHFSARYTTAQEADTRPWGLLAADDQEDNMSAQDVRDGVAQFFWDAYHAATTDDTYAKATDDEKRRMRNYRDVLRGIVGGPTDLGPLLSAVKAGDVDVDRLGVVIGQTVTAGLGGQLDVGGLTAEQVSAIVQDGVRAVLTRGVGAPAGS